MSFKFDTEKLMRQVTQVATDRIMTVLQEAKREMGADGSAIRINKASSLQRSGDKLDLGNVSFPSDTIKERFLQIVHRKMR